MGTLISARLDKYYANIVKDITRVQLGYELIKTLHRATESETEPDYYDILNTGFQSLNDDNISTELIRFWFQSQLLRFSGHAPNLHTDTNDQKLSADQNYLFAFDSMSFSPKNEAPFNADHIKLLRLAFSATTPPLLGQIQGVQDLVNAVAPLVQTMLRTHIRI